MAGITDCETEHQSVNSIHIQVVCYSQKEPNFMPMEWLGLDWFIIIGLLAIVIAFTGSKPYGLPRNQRDAYQ
jgi:hypothetical protein